MLCPQNVVEHGFQRFIVRLPSQSLPPEEVSFTGTALKVLREAVELQETMHGSYVAQEHLILTPLQLHLFSKESGLTEAAIKTTVQQICSNRHIDSQNAKAGFETLKEYAVDLIALAEEGKTDPVIMRGNGICRVIRILCRRYIFLQG